MSATDLIEQMRLMPTEEKREFIEKVWAEYGDELGWIEPDLTPEQLAELDRRLADFEKNPHEGIPWEQVEADLNKRFNWK